MALLDADGNPMKPSGDEMKETHYDGNVTPEGLEAQAKAEGIRTVTREERNAIDNEPWLTSDDIKCLPMGSRMIVRAYLESQLSSGGIIKSLDEQKIVPVMEVMKIGPKVIENGNIKEGMWVLKTDMSKPGVMRYGNEVFYVIQEHDVSLVFAEKPAYEDVMGTNTTIVRDQSQYVKMDKLRDLKLNITEGADPSLGLSEEDMDAMQTGQ